MSDGEQGGRTFVWRVGLVAMCLTIAACEGDTGLDHYTMSEAIVRGTVAAADGAPVSGAQITVVGVQAWSSGCDATPSSAGFTAFGRSGADGAFLVRLVTGPFGVSPTCVSIRVVPAGGAVADTVLAGIRVTAAPPTPNGPADTAVVVVRLRLR